MSTEERAAFVAAVLELKKMGRYDEYVHWHHAVMQATVHPSEPVDPNYRNGAHRGPAFLPWHREFLLQVENDLGSIDASITIPYWDWTEDAASSPTASSLWAPDFMGGNGLEVDDWRVQDGPFAFQGGNWNIPKHHDGPALRRHFGKTQPTLPTKEDLALALAEPFYDSPPYNSSPFTLGFRNRIEGWITQRGDSRVKFPGSQLHNRVHLWVGGSMEPMTSPNDPVFFLHHCFVDKIWADWQQIKISDDLAEGVDTSPHYAPRTGGPGSHNLDDVMQPWGARRIRDVLDATALGYQYEEPTAGPTIQALIDLVRPTSPFMSPRSPFAAE
jgi:tyrosinase